ncbi:MAG: hypothetical protein V4649_07665 [Bacteroidota bacterium]
MQLKCCLFWLFSILGGKACFAQAPAIQWEKSYGGSAYEHCNSALQTSEGGFITAGSTYSTDHDIATNHGLEDFWIVKLSATGALEWQKTFGGSSYDQARAIDQTSDGGYIVAGTTTSTDGDMASCSSGTGSYVIKLDNTGSVEWKKCIGGTNVDYVLTIQQTTDGGYISAGANQTHDG